MANILTTLTPERAQAVLDLISLSGSSGASSSGTSGDTTVAGTTPDLAAFLQAIPYANDGDVITPDHHNTLRAAFAAIAQGLDASQFAKVVKSSFLPALLPSDPTVSAWQVFEGKSAGPSNSPHQEAKGWMPLDLPGGTSIDTMTIHVSTTTKPQAWTADLRRIPLTGGNADDIIGGDFTDNFQANGGSITVPFSKIEGEVTPAIEADLRRVDNSTYTYVFSTDCASTALSATELSLIQVTCVRG
jgi:hypothetical protein